MKSEIYIICTYKSLMYINLKKDTQMTSHFKDYLKVLISFLLH